MERNDLFLFLVEFGASWNRRVGFITAEKVEFSNICRALLRSKLL
jgi:hypothetical protein